MCKPPSLLAVADAADELRRQGDVTGDGVDEEAVNGVSFDWNESEHGSDWLSPEESGWDWMDVCGAPQTEAFGPPAVDAGAAKTRLLNTKTFRKPGLRPVAPAGMVPQGPFMPGVMPNFQAVPVQSAWQAQMSPAQAWYMQQHMAQLGQQYLQASKMMMAPKMPLGGARKGVESVPIGFPVAGFPAPAAGFAGVPQMCQQPDQMPVQMESADQFEMFGGTYGALPNPANVSGTAPTQGQGLPMGKKKQGSSGAMPKLASSSLGGMSLPGTEEWGGDDTDGEDAEGGGVCEKKMKRMLSNRASAKRSRQRRQERLDELEIQSAKLRVENAQLVRKQNEADKELKKYAQENSRLRLEVEELRALLESHKLTPTTSFSTKGASSCAIESKAVSSKNQAESSKSLMKAYADETMADSPSETVPTSSNSKGTGAAGLVVDAADVNEQAGPLAQATSPGRNPSEDSAIDSQAGFVEPDLLAFGPSSEEMEGSGSLPGDGGMVVDEWFEQLCQSIDGKPLEAFTI